MTLRGAELNLLMLSGSNTNLINGGGSHIHNGVFLDEGFKVFWSGAIRQPCIDSDFDCSGGSFMHSAVQGGETLADEKPALFLGAARIEGPVWLNAGFKADGAVDIDRIMVPTQPRARAADRQPGDHAISAWGANISGAVILGGSGGLGAIEATALVQFWTTPELLVPSTRAARSSSAHHPRPREGSRQAQ